MLRILKLEQSAKPECRYQKLLEEVLGGTHVTIQGVGTTDITTDDAHIEIKKWSSYQSVPGQLSKYQMGLPRPRSCVYFFGTKPKSLRLNHIINLMRFHRIELYSVDENDQIINWENRTVSFPRLARTLPDREVQ